MVQSHKLPLVPPVGEQASFSLVWSRFILYDDTIGLPPHGQVQHLLDTILVHIIEKRGEYGI